MMSPMTIAIMMPDTGLFSNPRMDSPIQTLADNPNHAINAVSATPGSTATALLNSVVAVLVVNVGCVLWLVTLQFPPD
jgi:hypothetical protein